MAQGKSRVVRFRPETYARARVLYPVLAQPDDVIGYVLDLDSSQNRK